MAITCMAKNKKATDILCYTHRRDVSNTVCLEDVANVLIWLKWLRILFSSVRMSVHYSTVTNGQGGDSLQNIFLFKYNTVVHVLLVFLWFEKFFLFNKWSMMVHLHFASSYSLNFYFNKIVSNNTTIYQRAPSQCEKTAIYSKVNMLQHWGLLLRSVGAHKIARTNKASCEKKYIPALINVPFLPTIGNAVKFLEFKFLIWEISITIS
jgi:hypothetical protein